MYIKYIDMTKTKKLYIASLFFLACSLVFIALLVFIKITNKNDEYVLVSRVFGEGISALFFYIAYAFSIASLVLTILSINKNILLIQRISFFVRVIFIMFLVTPFFT